MLQACFSATPPCTTPGRGTSRFLAAVGMASRQHEAANPTVGLVPAILGPPFVIHIDKFGLVVEAFCDNNYLGAMDATAPLKRKHCVAKPFGHSVGFEVFLLLLCHAGCRPPIPLSFKRRYVRRPSRPSVGCPMRRRRVGCLSWPHGKNCVRYVRSVAIGTALNPNLSSQSPLQPTNKITFYLEHSSREQRSTLCRDRQFPTTKSESFLHALSNSVQV